MIEEDTCGPREEVAMHGPYLARANLSRAVSRVLSSKNIGTKARIATGPLPGVTLIIVKTVEVIVVAKDGVKESDTATYTGVPKSGNRDHARRDTGVAAVVVGDDATAKATSEIRSSVDEET